MTKLLISHFTVYTHIIIQKCAHSPTHAHIHTCMRTSTHLHTGMNACTHMLVYTHTNIYKHIHKQKSIPEDVLKTNNSNNIFTVTIFSLTKRS